MFIPAVIVVMVGCLGFILAVGAVNSKAEDEYWDEFWRQTPSTESPPEDATETRPTAMKKAA